MKRPNSYFGFYVAVLIAIMHFGIDTINAQVLNAPSAAPNPNLGSTTAWTAACASDSFNEYFVNFTWSPPLVDSANNEFILELSDANGNFGSPMELARVSDMNTTFDFEFEFTVPNTVRGESYKMRVRSTNPAKTSPASEAYPMHFVDYNSPLLISEDGNGTIPAGGAIQVCGTDITLMPHNIPNADTYQYNWYRSGTLLAQKTESITVSTPGMYYVELDYGSVCSGSANTLSNTIEIRNGSSLGIAINGSDDIPLCSGDTYLLQANLTGQGLTYTWYKDGTIVSGPTLEGDSYSVSTSSAGFDGNYEVEITGGTACTERSNSVAIRNLGNFEVTRGNAESIVLLPSQNTTLTVTTTAGTPSYQWYKDGGPIVGATNTTLDVNEAGSYFARVTENGAGCSGSPIDSEATIIAFPDSFELVIGYVGAYTSCLNTETTLSLDVINAVSSNGAKTDVTSDLQNSFTYQWKLDGADVTGETSRTITVSDFEDNGMYSLEGDLNTFNPTSNDLDVTLTSSAILEITSNGTVFCDGGDAIVLETSKDLSGDTFEWLHNGVAINTSSENITASETGIYQLIINTNACPLVSNEITVTAFDESLLVLDQSENIVIVEGETETMTASGADSYQWFDATNNLLASTDSYSFELEGEYLLVASFGSCTVNKVITVTYRDTFSIPNVITANGDGINDLWVLPNTFSRNDEVLVTIYNEKGKEVFSQTNYENNWPESTISFNKQNMIFYYKVTKGGESLKQGTITVIR